MPQPQLFGNSEHFKTKPSPRILAMERAEAKARVEFKRAYYRFFIRYAETHDTLIAEDVQRAFKLSPLPQPDDWRCTGGIVRRMIRDRTIEKTGEYRNTTATGVPVAVYRLRRTR